MSRPTFIEMLIIGSFLEGFFFGLYSGIFALYLQCHASKKNTDRAQNIIFYSIFALYVLSAALFFSDITSLICELLAKVSGSMAYHFGLIGSTLSGCCDFIAQCILIYRCWIVWGCNIHVVIIPLILTIAFLATWLVSAYASLISSNQFLNPRLEEPIFTISLVLSLVVNALVTGLIVFRILKVFREVKTTSEDQILGTTSGSKLWRIIFILIESGMALFAIQLARIAISFGNMKHGASYVIIPIREMVTGITPTIILVRTSMGLSFHDEKSMEEVAIGSFRFASNHTNSVLGTGSVSNVGQEDDIDIVERDEP